MFGAVVDIAGCSDSEDIRDGEVVCTLSPGIAEGCSVGLIVGTIVGRTVSNFVGFLVGAVAGS